MRVDYGGYGEIAALFVAASLILGWGAAVRAQSAANAPEAHAFTPAAAQASPISPPSLTAKNPIRPRLPRRSSAPTLNRLRVRATWSCRNFTPRVARPPTISAVRNRAITDFGKAVDLAQRKSGERSDNVCPGTFKYGARQPKGRATPSRAPAVCAGGRYRPKGRPETRHAVHCLRG